MKIIRFLTAITIGVLINQAVHCHEDSSEPHGNHSLAQEAESIRANHLKRHEDKLVTEPAELHRTCKYVSDISTHPPKKRVVLTFDDGPDPTQTDLILNVLKQHQIAATFFLIGSKAKKYPSLVDRMTSENHTIGNHSWEHPNFHEIPADTQALEVIKTEEVLNDHLMPKLFRYPYGNSTCDTNDLVRTRGYKIVGWHVDTCDWAFDRTGSVDDKEAKACGVLDQNRADFVNHVLATAKQSNGGIILLHEIHPNTIKQLNTIITRLKNDGYTFGSITEDDFLPSMR